MSDFQLKNPLIVGLDVDSCEEALRIAQTLSGKVGAFKIGPRLVVRGGSDFISKLAKLSSVFVDMKYHDIPSTMDAAVRASAEAGASLVTVHASAGREALSLLAKAEKEIARKQPFRLLAVTVLTSFANETLPTPFRNRAIADIVNELAFDAKESGLSGFVCSSQEVANLRSQIPRGFLVTPGIRLPDGVAGDQKRVETPQTALKKGASAIVVARPICEAKDPVSATEKFLAAIAEVKV